MMTYCTCKATNDAANAIAAAHTVIQTHLIQEQSQRRAFLEKWMQSFVKIVQSSWRIFLPLWFGQTDTIGCSLQQVLQHVLSNSPNVASLYSQTLVLKVKVKSGREG